MSGPYLSIARLERRLTIGGIEELTFAPGVSLMVGRSSTGKTKWLQTLDYLLGDTGENPFAGAEETGLSEKYDAAAAQLLIGDTEVRIERRWQERGAKGKVFVNGEGMLAAEFQQWLMARLEIPLLHFPKGNPMSGQTWPELSFRILLRHIYRQQRFWADIADKQPEGEQHACVLQFLGLAERVFTKEYGQLIELKREVERLKARREQYLQTLNELARDTLADGTKTVGVSAATVQQAGQRISQEIDDLRLRRTALLTGARDQILPPDLRGRAAALGEKRAEMLARLEELRRKEHAVAERLTELKRYRAELGQELERMGRAEDAAAVLADLKISHCPACDQTVTETEEDPDHCFLCHQTLPDKPLLAQLGAVRLRFERDRLTGEYKEAEALVTVLDREAKRLAVEAAAAEAVLQDVENSLAPARAAVSALAQEHVSAIDMALGAASERQHQVGRITAALALGDDLTVRIVHLEQQIEPLQSTVDELVRATDFDAAVTHLEDGMNAYLAAINRLRPGVWLHNPVNIDASRWSLAMRVGARRWHVALGGTDQLYFLMAYHYGLLTLSAKTGCHYPGLSVIDFPAEFAGVDVRDRENFIVQPFIDLLSQDEYRGAQLIITGAAFEGLQGAHRHHFTHVHVA